VRRAPTAPPPGGLFLERVTIRDERRQPGVHPFELPLLAPPFSWTLTTPVTFLVGENGSGKSSLLEGLAEAVGFQPGGGTRDHRVGQAGAPSPLGSAMGLVWRRQTAEGFFLRAETFFHFASYLEEVGSAFATYGGIPLHAMSHGEAFLALFRHRFRRGLFILDEPEAALSPARQLAFLAILHELTQQGAAQFVIATHSPMLLAFPGATVLSLDGGTLRAVEWHETEHVQLTRDFLNAPARYFRELFNDA
jgi:predicted ATPase